MQITRLYTVFDIMDDEAVAVKSFVDRRRQPDELSNWLVAKNPGIDTA